MVNSVQVAHLQEYTGTARFRLEAWLVPQVPVDLPVNVQIPEPKKCFEMEHVTANDLLRDLRGHFLARGWPLPEGRTAFDDIYDDCTLANLLSARSARVPGAVNKN